MALDEIPGVVDLQVEKQVRIPQLEIIVDYGRAALYGLQPAAVTEQLEQLSNGRIVSRIVDGNKRFDVVLRLEDEERTTRGLGDLLIETPNGWIPVSQIADVVETDGPNQILRENGKRRLVVLAQLGWSDRHGPDRRTDPRRDGRKGSADRLLRNSGRHLPGTGRVNADNRSSVDPVAGDDLRHPLQPYRSPLFVGIIMASVPLALIGSVAALWWAGQPLSVASMVGFITLTGIATRNGILKISHYINLAIQEDMPFGRDLVIRGSLERLTPVLMTALSAGVALIPLMLGADAPGKEILHPVAITIFGAS